MAYFLLDTKGQPVGPYSREELRIFLDRGLVLPDVLVTSDGTGVRQTIRDVVHGAPRPSAPAGNAADPESAAEFPSTEPPSAASDFLRLAPHLMLPIEDIVRLRWFDNRRILALAIVGLLPLFLLLYLQTTGDLGGSIWGVALYSSVLWALFFFITFSQPEVSLLRCILSFLGSAVFSIGLVALARFLIPFEWVFMWINSPNLGTRWAGHLVGVAAIEELAKLFMPYFLWQRRIQPRVMMFYGLLAGLGFGIYEGVAYQSSQNLRISFPTGRTVAEGAGVYYMLNILRLTSLPFLHAMWTGIAGYFIGFAAQFPTRQGGLLLAAFVVPSLLHATYNTFSDSLIGLTVALISVIALNLYLVKGRDFEALLAGRQASGSRPR